jgi:hypothetical protein
MKILLNLLLLFCFNEGYASPEIHTERDNPINLTSKTLLFQIPLIILDNGLFTEFDMPTFRYGITDNLELSSLPLPEIKYSILDSNSNYIKCQSFRSSLLLGINRFYYLKDYGWIMPLAAGITCKYPYREIEWFEGNISYQKNILKSDTLSEALNIKFINGWQINKSMYYAIEYENYRIILSKRESIYRFTNSLGLSFGHYFRKFTVKCFAGIGNKVIIQNKPQIEAGGGSFSLFNSGGRISFSQTLGGSKFILLKTNIEYFF